MAMRFELYKPVEVALKYATGLAVTSQLNGGPQVMFTLVGDEKMYLEPETATRIEAMGVRPGEKIVICKRRAGKQTLWSVTRAGESETAPREASGPPPLAARAAERPYEATDEDLPEGLFSRSLAATGGSPKLLAQALRAAAAVLEGSGS